MSKPIKLTQEIINREIEKFKESILNMKMFDGKITYSSDTFTYGDDEIKIIFSVTAYTKMKALVQNYDTEVAWHGIVERDEDDPHIFRITDILVYPQYVSGGTVNTDQIPYQNWLQKELPFGTVNKIRMQGHSHVNFSTTPSGVDLAHQSQIVDMLGDDDYYIFIIWNKRDERTIKVFDLKENTLYENKDIKLLVGDYELDITAFLTDAKTKTKRESYKPKTIEEQLSKDKKDSEDNKNTSLFDRHLQSLKSNGESGWKAKHK